MTDERPLVILVDRRILRWIPRAMVLVVALASTAGLGAFLMWLAGRPVGWSEAGWVAAFVVAVAVGWIGVRAFFREAWGQATVLQLAWMAGPLVPMLHVYGGLVVTAIPSLISLVAWLVDRSRGRVGAS